MINWVLEKFRTKRIRFLEDLVRKLRKENGKLAVRRLERCSHCKFYENQYNDERAMRLKLVRVYEEKKVKYNALQGRYQSKADRLVNLNKKLLKEAQNEK